MYGVGWANKAKQLGWKAPINLAGLGTVNKPTAPEPFESKSKFGEEVTPQRDVIP
jgi:hypothetical protein